jgi:prophage antirepressor-like protein
MTRMNSLALPASVAFDGTDLTIIDRNGTPWLAATDLARALGYARADFVAKLYRAHATEFTPDMSLNVELALRGQVAPTPVRIFSPRGCHLIAMFARTPKAAAFRRWVLDVLESFDRSSRSPVTPSVPAELLSAVQAELQSVQRELLRTLRQCVGLQRHVIRLQHRLLPPSRRVRPAGAGDSPQGQLFGQAA